EGRQTSIFVCKHQRRHETLATEGCRGGVQGDPGLTASALQDVRNHLRPAPPQRWVRVVYLDNSPSTPGATRHTCKPWGVEVAFASENNGNRHSELVPGPGAGAREIGPEVSPHGFISRPSWEHGILEKSRLNQLHSGHYGTAGVRGAI